MRDKLPKSAPLKIPSPRAKRVDLSQRSWVAMNSLFEDRPMPLVVSPVLDGVQLVSWAEQHRHEISDLVFEHGAVLFRGFDITEMESFRRFVEVTSNGPALDYRDRSTPREVRGEKIYTSTVYPSDQAINPHNEGTYWLTWALKLFFYCRKAAQSGGEALGCRGRKFFRQKIPWKWRNTAGRTGSSLNGRMATGYGPGRFGLPSAPIPEQENWSGSTMRPSST
jgi:hypothetical protein